VVYYYNLISERSYSLLRGRDFSLQMSLPGDIPTKKTLLELEKFSQTFGLCQRKAGAFEKVKSVMNKTKFAMELPKVDALRARLQYQNGTLNLLLTSAGKYRLSSSWQIRA